MVAELRLTEEENCCIPSFPPPFRTRRASARSGVTLDKATSWLPWHRRAGWSWCTSLTPSDFKLCRTELNPFGSHCGSRKARSLSYQALCVFSFTLDSSVTSYWVGKAFRAKEAEKSFPGRWHWDVPRRFQGLNGQGLAQQPTAGGGHWLPSYLDLTSKWLRFPTEAAFYCLFFKGKRETKRVHMHTCAKMQRGWVG